MSVAHIPAKTLEFVSIYLGHIAATVQLDTAGRTVEKVILSFGNIMR